MVYKICYWDAEDRCQRERDASPEEAAEIESRKLYVEPLPPPPTKEQLLAKLQELQAQINSLA